MDSFDSAYEKLELETARSDLSEQGWTPLPSPMRPELLAAIRDQVDQFAMGGQSEVNHGGSEHRVWQAHRQSPEIDLFRLYSDRVMSAVVGRPWSSHDILAIRNKSVDPHETSHHEGRWHVDSFRRQLKIFVFLTDVTEASGPFELVSGTHARLFKLSELIKGRRITPSDLVRGTRSYTRFDESYVDELLAQDHDVTVFDVSAGTALLVDTSCVHRARPCISGIRYALTSYYR